MPAKCSLQSRMAGERIRFQAVCKFFLHLFNDAMTISDFSLLKLTDQLALLYTEGVFLCKRKSGSMTVLLFQFQSTYIEIFYTRYRRVVHHIRYSQSTRILDPYLSSIVIGNFSGTNS